MCSQPISTATLGTSALKTVITHYYRDLKDYEGKADYELALRSAFQNLLADTARMVNWILIPEQTLDGGIRPDGVMRDTFNLRRGYWEAKGPKSDLEKEIVKKIGNNYPLVNTIFENTKRAVLYQNKKRQYEYDLHNPTHVSDLLRQFFTYTEPDIANFEAAVQEFKQRIPELAQGLLETIEQEHKLNRKFITAFDTFANLCRTSLDPKIGKEAVNEMLVQHLLTKRLFRTIFGNSDFTNRNIIATEIEKVIQALTSRVFNADDFLKNLDRFYVAIEAAAKGLESWSERQHFLNTVYERFFQGFSVKQADTHGIVYTPQEIVDFMCASVDEVLQREFGTSISEPGVQILDPATGTGNFIVNLMRRIPRSKLKYKYQHDLFCNEIMLLPYYIASLNIEHEYYERMKEYESFEGICFADTLALAERLQLSLFVEENTERVQREKDAQIMVVIGNPPYNAWQKNENDNNDNRSYSIIDERIRKTYVKDSAATLRNSLYDPYVRFFRWATDRLNGRDGIVCYISNNSFIDQYASDGMRSHLLQDFTQIYHLDLHGNVRRNPKLSGTTHNVFGIQVGVGITIAVRSSNNHVRKVYYYRLAEDLRKEQKLAFIAEKESISKIDWQELEPDGRHTWITAGMKSEFPSFLPMGTKVAKASKSVDMPVIFRMYSGGVKTNRDTWAYDFHLGALEEKMKVLIDAYNNDVSRWQRREDCAAAINDFITYDDTKIKWSDYLKNQVKNGRYVSFSQSNCRRSFYRPFTRKYLYFDVVLNDARCLQHFFFPTASSELENVLIVVSDVGYRAAFSVLAVNAMPELHLSATTDAFQCFPYYIYSADGSNRRENITDWALQQFQDKYCPQVTKWDIFYYIYGMLHHPQYRERYKENLKRDLPHIPLLLTREAFDICVRVGKQLMDIHLNYEQLKEYPLKWIENEDIPFSWHVKKMRLTPDRTAVIVNESLTLSGIPQECFQYRLGNRSALEWVIDQYQVSKDKRSGIESDPNRLDDEEYIVRLIGKVVTVSVETVKLVNELAQTVTVQDWLSETGEMIE
jgi:predicted helicase